MPELALVTKSVTCRKAVPRVFHRKLHQKSFLREYSRNSCFAQSSKCASD